MANMDTFTLNRFGLLKITTDTVDGPSTIQFTINNGGGVVRTVEMQRASGNTIREAESRESLSVENIARVTGAIDTRGSFIGHWAQAIAINSIEDFWSIMEGNDMNHPRNQLWQAFASNVREATTIRRRGGGGPFGGLVVSRRGLQMMKVQIEVATYYEQGQAPRGFLRNNPGAAVNSTFFDLSLDDLLELTGDNHLSARGIRSLNSRLNRAWREVFDQLVNLYAIRWHFNVVRRQGGQASLTLREEQEANQPKMAVYIKFIAYNQGQRGDTPMDRRTGSFLVNSAIARGLNYIGCYAPPGHRTPKHEKVVHDFLVKKKSVLLIRNTDSLCIPRAISAFLVKALCNTFGNVVEEDCMRVLEQCGFISTVYMYKSVKHAAEVVTKKGQDKLLLKLATYILKACGMEGKKTFGLGDLPRFEDGLNVHIRMYDVFANFSKVYSGNEQYKTKVYLLKYHDHVHVTLSRKGLMGRSYECRDCDTLYNDTNAHRRCPNRCFLCGQRPCPFETDLAPPIRTHCDICNVTFPNESCYSGHLMEDAKGKSQCDLRHECGRYRCKGFKPGAYADMSKHRCSDQVCKNCGGMVTPSLGLHQCSMVKKPLPKPNNKLLFFDFECTQENDVHTVTHAVFQDYEGEETVFAPVDGDVDGVLGHVCTWLFSINRFKNYTVIAHNGQGYDFQFILKWALSNKTYISGVIRDGQKLKCMTICNVRFIDSLCFLMMPLSGFPKTFGLSELRKGYFPHLFNTRANQSYVGSLPPMEDYMYNTMKPSAREAFVKWYGEESARVESGEYVFDFQRDIVSYCKSDVDILRRGCLSLRDLFIDVTGMDPFKKITIAGTCLQIFRSNFLHEGTIFPVSPSIDKWVRKGFFGGRTQVFKAYTNAGIETAKRGEPMVIRYADVTSLYPWVNTTCEYPIGPPREVDFTGHEFTNAEGIRVFLNSSFGMVECDITCPTDLLIPLLPSKEKNGRLQFDLTPKRNAVYCIQEVLKAMDLGYKVTRIYKALVWKEHGTQLFKDYMLTFLKLKQEASGWNGKVLDGKQVETEEEKVQWIANYKEDEGVLLDKDKVTKNPGLRAIAKLCLNSLWGKMGQSPSDEKTRYCNTVSEVVDLFKKKGVEVKHVLEVGDKHEVRYTEQSDDKSHHTPENFSACSPLAAFTTSWARLKLYTALEKLQDKVLYCDTDSVIYVSRANNEGGPEIELGDKLGEWTDELGDGEDSIVEFVAAGPKSYAYRTQKGKDEVKCKGIRISYQNSLSVANFENIRNAVLGQYATGTHKRHMTSEQVFTETVTSHKIQRVAGTKDVVTARNVVKVFKPTLENKGVVDTDTLRVNCFM